MSIPIADQLEAFTSFNTYEVFARFGIKTKEHGLFTLDGQDVRKLFTFSRDQLIEYLRENPERTTSSLQFAQQLRGIYDRDVLEREGNQYVLYWQDHDCRRNEKFYDDMFEGVADWLSVQHGMWLYDRNA